MEPSTIKHVRPPFKVRLARALKRIFIPAWAELEDRHAELKYKMDAMLASEKVVIVNPEITIPGIEKVRGGLYLDGRDYCIRDSNLNIKGPLQIMGKQIMILRSSFVEKQ